MSADSKWENKVREIERSNRRLLRSQRGLWVLALLFVAGSFQSTSERSLRVEDLRIVDGQGRERAFLGSRDGVPELSFFDEAGVVQAKLGLSTEGEGGTFSKDRPVLLLGPPSSPFVALGVGGSGVEDAFPTLTLTPPNGEGVTTILGSNKIGANLGFLSIGGGGPWGVMPRVSLSVPSDGPVDLQVRDADGKLTFSSQGAIEWNGSNFFPVGRREDAIALSRLAPTPASVECLGPEVTDDVVEALGRIEGIRSLYLRACPTLTEASLRSVSDMEGLELLHVTNCPGLAQGSYASLVDSKIERLLLVSMPLDDAAVEALSKMMGLKELTLLLRDVDPEWQVRLEKALPNARILVGEIP